MYTFPEFVWSQSSYRHDLYISIKQEMKKAILITGASSGLGKESTIKFQKEGSNVIATMRNTEMKLN